MTATKTIVTAAGGIEVLDSSECKGGLYVRAHEHNRVYAELQRSLSAEAKAIVHDQIMRHVAMTEKQRLWLINDIGQRIDVCLMRARVVEREERLEQASATIAALRDRLDHIAAYGPRR